MQEDWQEQKNLYDQYPEVVKELTLLLGEYIRRGRSTPGEDQKNDSIDFEWKQADIIRK